MTNVKIAHRRRRPTQTAAPAAAAWHRPADAYRTAADAYRRLAMAPPPHRRRYHRTADRSDPPAAASPTPTQPDATLPPTAPPLPPPLTIRQYEVTPKYA